MEYSKTFCPYPWIHIMTQPTGTVSWCCVARDNFKNDDGTMFDLNKGDKIESVWNNNHMRKIRKQMIAGEVVKGCEHCYDLEKMGFPSYRTNYIRDWFEYSRHGESIMQRIERSIDNDYVVEEAPMYLDFRLGNLCNLKCRMCQPQNSSQIQKEYKRIEENDPMAADFIKNHFTWGQFADHITPWQDDPDFLRQVEAWLPGVNKLYFTGGEPTLIERTYWILEKCVEMDIAKNIDLVFNSNMTNIKPRFISLVEKFKNVLMCFSVDAYGELNEYIRGASHWTTTDINVRNYCSSRVVGSLLFSPVIQVYNILDITRLLDYCEDLEKEYEREIHLTFLICDYPRSLDFRILPDSVRNVAINRLEAWIPTSKILVKRENNLQALHALIRALKENRHDDWEKQLAIFQRYTTLLDSTRGENMKTAIPELWNLMYASNQ
jgi:MoaA/NifB/PqqE/SkfB family radical SAM enzyme